MDTTIYRIKTLNEFGAILVKEAFLSSRWCGAGNNQLDMKGTSAAARALARQPLSRSRCEERINGKGQPEKREGLPRRPPR